MTGKTSKRRKTQRVPPKQRKKEVNIFTTDKVQMLVYEHLSSSFIHIVVFIRYKELPGVELSLDEPAVKGLHLRFISNLMLLPSIWLHGLPPTHAQRNEQVMYFFGCGRTVASLVPTEDGIRISDAFFCLIYGALEEWNELFKKHGLNMNLDKE